MLSGEHRIVSDGVHATCVDISDKLALQEEATRQECRELFEKRLLELSHTHRGEYCFTPKKWLELLDRNG